MSRDREAGVTTPGSTASTPWPALPVLPLALLASAVLVALLASQQVLPAWLTALALLLATAGALTAGACWRQQRHHDQLHDARQQSHLLGQLLDTWCWQTDADHRLVTLQPPQGAPVSAWAPAVTGGDLLWQRFDDPTGGLQPRMQAHSPLAELAVRHGDTLPLAWRLRGLPRFDSQGRFTGYLGLAWPTAHADQAQFARQGLDALLAHGPAALCLARPAADGPGWVLHRASPAAAELLGLAGASDDPQAWPQVLAGLPDGLRERVRTLAPGQTIECDGWRARLEQLGREDRPDSLAWLLSLVPLVPLPSTSDSATLSLAAEHAAFAYTISHDLRSPIRVVEGFGRILKEDYSPVLDRAGRDHVERVIAAATRMNQMIDAMLSLSRLSTQPLAEQTVDLSKLAGQVIADLRRQSPELVVSVHIAPGLQAQGDPALLLIVLDNLLGNAWKYSAQQAQAEIRFEPAAPEGRACLVVSDNGAGFDMRFADRLFGVFQRLHSASDFPGTGIGLASVRRIVRRHGGEIWAESAVGQGARFYFTLKG